MAVRGMDVVAEGDSVRFRLSIAALTGLVVVVHGPLDVLVTLAYPALEANPVVRALSLTGWLATKAIALLGALGLASHVRRRPEGWYATLIAVWLAGLLAFGVMVGGPEG